MHMREIVEQMGAHTVVLEALQSSVFALRIRAHKPQAGWHLGHFRFNISTSAQIFVWKVAVTHAILIRI